jgi:hypothetical protein
MTFYFITRDLRFHADETSAYAIYNYIYDIYEWNPEFKGIETSRCEGNLENSDHMNRTLNLKGLKLGRAVSTPPRCGRPPCLALRPRPRLASPENFALRRQGPDKPKNAGPCKRLRRFFA